MPDSTKRLRLKLRAHCLDLLAVVPDALDEAILERGESEAVEVVILARPRDSAPPIPADFLLTRLEQSLVAILLAATTRLTFTGLRDLAEERQGEQLGEGPLRTHLARLVEVAILDNDRKARPPGYQITAAFRAYLKSCPIPVDRTTTSLPDSANTGQVPSDRTTTSSGEPALLRLFQPDHAS